MNKNTINLSNLNNLYKSIDDDIYTLNINLIKIEKLIEILETSFNIDRQKEQYSIINEKNIYILKKYIGKYASLNYLLKKIGDAYNNMENDFSAKEII